MGLMTDIAESDRKGIGSKEFDISSDIKPVMDVAMVGLTGIVALKGVEAISKVI